MTIFHQWSCIYQKDLKKISPSSEILFAMLECKWLSGKSINYFGIIVIALRWSLSCVREVPGFPSCTYLIFSPKKIWKSSCWNPGSVFNNVRIFVTTFFTSNLPENDKKLPTWNETTSYQRLVLNAKKIIKIRIFLSIKISYIYSFGYFGHGLKSTYMKRSR